MKANLIILGAQKCATTTLFKILTRSPRIVGARVKEPHFFSSCADWTANLLALEIAALERLMEKDLASWYRADGGNRAEVA